MEIGFRDLCKNDKEYFFSWIKDKEVIKYSLSIFQKMKSDEDISRWFDKLLVDKSSYKKAIVDMTKKKIIGYAGIADISETNLSGEYFIFIGEKSYHGKGVGTYVTKEIVKQGFENLNLNRIMLTAFEKNISAKKAYSKAGFKMEGIMRQSSYRYGEFYDKILMSILKEEYLDEGREH